MSGAQVRSGLVALVVLAAAALSAPAAVALPGIAPTASFTATPNPKIWARWRSCLLSIPGRYGLAEDAISRAYYATMHAAKAALLVHTMAYAGFYEDPIAWVLLAAGLSLASAPVRDGP